jgi:hypothetical protein
MLTWGKRRFGRGFGLLVGLKEGKVSDSGTFIGVLWPEVLVHWSKRFREKA